MNRSSSELGLNATWSMAVGEMVGGGIFTLFGAVASAAAAVTLVVRLSRDNPLALGFLAVLVLLAAFGRPLLLRRFG